MFFKIRKYTANITQNLKASLAAQCFLCCITTSILYADNTSMKEFEELSNAMSIIKKEYIHDLTNKQLMKSAIKGMFESLDPYSDFLTREEYNEMQSFFDGKYGGIGVEIHFENGFVKVISPYEDSPAFKAGIQVGDYITIADGKPLKNLKLKEVLGLIRGKPQSNIELTVHRPSTGENITYTIIRELFNRKQTISR